VAALASSADLSVAALAAAAASASAEASAAGTFGSSGVSLLSAALRSLSFCLKFMSLDAFFSKDGNPLLSR
jgi:hypothetical protein